MDTLTASTEEKTESNTANDNKTDKNETKQETPKPKVDDEEKSEDSSAPTKTDEEDDGGSSDTKDNEEDDGGSSDTKEDAGSSDSKDVEEKGQSNSSDEDSASSDTVDVEKDDAEENYDHDEFGLTKKFNNCFKKHQPLEKLSCEVYDIVEHFTNSSSFLGKIIISDFNRKNDEKLIAPIDKGIAGGEKFISRGLFFKFPKDKLVGEDYWVYGGSREDSELAGKACNNDIKGWSALFACDEENQFDFPLIVVIDYCGHRITSTTQIPLSNDTLIYGSGDGGRTVKHESEFINAKMRAFGEKLNLAPNLRNGIEMALCTDIEVHEVKDKLKKIYYVLDWARVFPPQSVIQSQQHSLFCSLLRPEFVKSDGIPKLISDAMSSFIGEDQASEAAQAINFVTQKLLQKAVEFSVKLRNTEYNSSFIVHPTKQLFEIQPGPSVLPDPLVVELHLSGINIRFLGIIRAKLRESKANDKMATFLLELMVARTLKNYWKTEVKKIKTTKTAEQICREFSVPMINQFISKNEALYSKIVAECLLKFGYGIPEIEQKNLFDFINIPCVMMKFFHLVGISLSPGAFLQFKTAFDKQTPLKPTFQLTLLDVVDFVPKLHYPDVLDFYCGFALIHQAQATHITLEQKKALYEFALPKLANSAFSSALVVSDHKKSEYRYWYSHAMWTLHTMNPTASFNSALIAQTFAEKLETSGLSVEETIKLKLTIYSVFFVCVNEKTPTVELVISKLCPKLLDQFTQANYADIYTTHLSAFAMFLENIDKYWYYPLKKKMYPFLWGWIPTTMPKTLNLSEFVGDCLTLGAAMGILPIVEYLINGKANINDNTVAGYTPLYYACAYDHKPVIEFLLERNAEVNFCNNQSMLTPLMAASTDGSLKGVENLLLYKANVLQVSKEGKSPLWCAANACHYSVAEKLIEAKADVNNSYGHTNDSVLHRACLAGDLPSTKLLISKKADIHAINSNGETPLMLAVYDGRYNVVKELIDEKADVNFVNTKGVTPLKYAVLQVTHLPTLTYLLDHNAQINFQDDVTGISPVMRAVFFGHVPIVSKLIECKADLNLPNKDGKTALTTAREKQNKELIELLEKNGAMEFVKPNIDPNNSSCQQQ